MRFTYTHIVEPWELLVSQDQLKPGIMYITKDLAHMRPGGAYNVENIRYFHLDANYKYSGDPEIDVVLRVYTEGGILQSIRYCWCCFGLNSIYQIRTEEKQTIYIRPFNPPSPFPTVGL